MRGVFGELRRRGVLGALTAYGVAAAGALQLADIVVQNLGLPRWTVRALIWTAVLGFVATGFISWFYDLTRRGFVRTQAPADRGPTPATPRKTTVPTPQPPPVPRELRQGAVLAGRYRLERELGKGGMGRLLIARDEKLDRRGAVKVVTAAHDPGGCSASSRRPGPLVRSSTRTSSPCTISESRTACPSWSPSCSKDTRFAP